MYANYSHRLTSPSEELFPKTSPPSLSSSRLLSPAFLFRCMLCLSGNKLHCRMCTSWTESRAQERGNLCEKKKESLEDAKYEDDACHDKNSLFPSGLVSGVDITTVNNKLSPTVCLAGMMEGKQQLFSSPLVRVSGMSLSHKRHAFSRQTMLNFVRDGNRVRCRNENI